MRGPRSRRFLARACLGAAIALLLSTIGTADASAAARDPDTPSATDREALTVNRIRLFVIHARHGAPRVVLPTLKEGRPTAEVDLVVNRTISALDRIRRRYAYADLEVVSQSEYLLQVIPQRSGGYRYRLLPEPSSPAFTDGFFQGIVSATTTDGRLAIAVSVFGGEDPLLEVEMLMVPGRPLVLARELPGGGALFAVLTTDSPGSPAAILESVPPAERGATEAGGRRAPETVRPAAPPRPDPSRVYMKWDVPPRLAESTEPKYPDIARRAGVEGRVRLHIVVGIDGTVEEVEVVRAFPRGIFDRAAVQAVQKWRYRPAILKGRPVRARFSQTLQFVLSEPGGGR